VVVREYRSRFYGGESSSCCSVFHGTSGSTGRLALLVDVDETVLYVLVLCHK
jgi:hypothetical protein